MINLITLFVIALFLIYLGVRRLISPPEVQGVTMLIVGAIAFVEDPISTWLLYRGMKGSINVRAAFIHMFGDTLATLGVIAGGFLIMQYGAYWVDSAITIAIAIYIAVHGYIEIRNAIPILMESAPKDFSFDRMVEEVEALDSVADMHHVHLWRLDERTVAIEAHIAVEEHDLAAIEEIKNRAKELLHDDLGVEHATLEIELAGRTGHRSDAIVAE